MGCAASGSEGWLGYYMQAEVDYRKAGGSLSGRMSTLHYASMLYPAQVLGDPELFPIVEEMLGGEFEEDNEVSLIGQWQACIDFDVTDRLPRLHARRCTSSPSSRTFKRRRSSGARSPRSRPLRRCTSSPAWATARSTATATRPSTPRSARSSSAL